MCSIIFACISVPPPALFIAGRSRWVTATNTLTRYGFLQSRLESRCAALRGPLCCRRTTGESAPNSGLHRTGHEPQVIRNPAHFTACSLKVSSPVPGRLSVGLWRLNLISRKGQSKLMGRDPPPPPPPPTRLLCHSSDVIKCTYVHYRTH